MCVNPSIAYRAARDQTLTIVVNLRAGLLFVPESLRPLPLPSKAISKRLTKDLMFRARRADHCAGREADFTAPLRAEVWRTWCMTISIHSIARIHSPRAVKVMQP